MNNDRVAKYAHSQDRIFEWFWYSHSYFSAAKLLAREFNASGAHSDEFFAPLIYNLRHGLELLLKLLAFGTGSDASDLWHHDIQKLFAKVKIAFSELNDNSISFAAEGLGVEKSLVTRYLEAMTDTIEGLARKYHSYEFLSEKTQIIEDPKNELFRYPSSTAIAGAFDLTKHSNTLSGGQALNDIDLLHKFLLSVVVLFGKVEGAHILRNLGNQSNKNA